MHPHRNTLMILLSALLLLLDKTGSVSILTPPQSLNVSLGSIVTFRCIVQDAQHVFWTVNGTTTDLITGATDNFFNLGDGNYSSVLTMPSYAEINDTNILCHAVYNTVVKSDPALLLIQGPLSQVGNLTYYTKDGNAVAVLWTSPYTLDNVPIDNYTLKLTGTHFGYYMQYTDTDSPMLLNLPDWCDQYRVTVVPNNAVGPGLSKTITVHQLEATRIIPETVLVRVHVSSAAGAKPLVEVMLNVTFPCAIPLNHTFKVPSIEATPPVSYGPYLTTTANEIVTILLSDLEYDVIYNFEMWDETIAGQSNNIIVEISTFDVQNATVTSDSEGVLCVTCYFVEGSEAGGCVVELALIGKETDHTFIHVSKTSTESEVTGCARGLLHGEYEIYVFDVGKDGVKSPNAPPAVFISSFTLSSSPIPSPSTNSETTSRVLSLPGTTRTELTTPTQVNNDRDSSSVANESAYRNSAIAVGLVIIVVIIVLLILIVFQVKNLRKRRKRWREGVVRETDVTEIRANPSNREGSSQGTNNAGGSLTPSPVLEAISEDAEAPPPPPPPPSPPAPPSFIIPHSSVSPSSSTEESSPTGNSDLPSPGAESTSSLLRLERKTIGEPTPLQQPSSTSTETKERQGQAIPTRRRSSSLRSTGALTAWSAVNPLTLPVLPEAPPPYDQIAKETTNRYYRPQSALITRNSNSHSRVTSNCLPRQYSAQYAELHFHSSTGRAARTHPHRLSAPVTGVQYAIISNYGVYLSHSRTSNSIMDSLV